MAKAKTAPRKPKDSSITGTYVYDQATGRMVRVRAGIPKVASKGSSAAQDCGRACESPSGTGGGCCGGGGCA